jgi:Cu/Zn superoxide dismutase
MKRYVLLVALFAAMLSMVGCESEGSSTKMNNPFKKKPAAAAAAAANYFEIKKDSKTYILASRESLQKVTKGEAGSLSLHEMPNYGPKGATVAFENSSYTDMNRLIAEYRKAKNMP